MTQESMISLGLYFVAMLAIGAFAYRTSTADNKDYMLGGRKVSPKVTALSAGASDMSGWMLMGLPGAMFTLGYDTLLIAIGLLIGALFNYNLVCARLRAYSEIANDAITLPEFFSQRFGRQHSFIRILTAAVILLFFTLYTSAGLVAGGKLFETAFNTAFSHGVLITAAVVVAYTLLGGFLAVSLTDFVQGCIMFIALVMVPTVAFLSFGETSVLASAHQSIPTAQESIQKLTLVGVLSSLAWGLGYFGQPHIIVRFMAMRASSDAKTTRNIGMSWMLVTICGAIGTGLVGVAYVNHHGLTLDDPETIFITFSTVLFHPLITGFLLAAILAAVMSTISSQLLVSSSALTEDLFRSLYSRTLSNSTAVTIGRISVIAIAAIASTLAMDRSHSILSLVSNAWAGFGAAFGPLVILSLFWRRMTYTGALAGIISGTATVIFWIYAPVLPEQQSLSSWMYELVPGFIVSTLAIYTVSKLSKEPDNNITQHFDTMKRQLSSKV